MSSITVPESFRNQLRAVPRPTDELKPTIRRLIEGRPNQVITTRQFIDACGTTSAMLHVKKLLRDGYISRERLKTGRGGRHYTYTWHDVPLDARNRVLRNGGVYLSTDERVRTHWDSKALDLAFARWAREAASDPSHVYGAAMFLRHLNGGVALMTDRET